MLDQVLYFIILIGCFVVLCGIFLMLLSVFNKFRFRTYKLDETYRPMVSMVVPAHNEGKVIERTIQYFLKTTYPADKKELIIVNDGSSDNTEEVICKYASKIINFDSQQILDVENRFDNVVLVNRKEGGHGKALALNVGKSLVKGEVLFLSDADIQLDVDVFEKAVRHLNQPDVGSVAGYVEVRGKKNFLGQFIDFEYVTGQKMLRRGFNVLGVHYIIPGGCAVFRKQTLDKIGDYHNDTLAEDTDITWRLLTETKDKIHFDPGIVVGADEPYILKNLWNQRVRWSRGNIEVTLKNKDKIFRPRYGRALTWAYPFWFSSIILPFAFISSACAVVLATALGIQLSILLVGPFLAITFFLSWIIGTLLNKGKSWLAGLLSPGIPLLITLLSILIWPDGLGGLLRFIGYTEHSLLIQLIMAIWVLIAIPGTYLSVSLSNKYPKIADALQLLVFGYWMFLVTTVFEGYRKEVLKKDKIWIRTER